MRLPQVSYADGIKTAKQDEFAGLNHNLGAKDGELWDMRNLCSDYSPLLATRSRRMLYKTLQDPGGLFCWDKLCWVDGTTFYYDGVAKGTVTAGRKTFTALGAYIVIFPDKAYYNTAADEFGNLEATWTGASLTFTNGKLYEEDAEANCIQAEGVNWEDYFKAGDAVTIAGCTKHTENNKTPVIREIDGDKLYFYEYIFTLDGEDGVTPYTETGELSVSRTVPDLLFVCENENRLWGCDKTTIYASKLGDIFNWNVYEGLATDSYSVDTGSAGSFTACISFLGYPIFFKEDHIYKVYGSIPTNFEVMGSATLGVAAGSDRSLAIAGEILFYHSRAGIMAYSGGIPQPVGAAFGVERFEDATQSTHFARCAGNLYLLDEGGNIWITGNIQNPPEEATMEDAFDWMAEFADWCEDSPNKKGVSKLLLRLEVDEGAEVQLFIMFDSTGEWIAVNGTLEGGVKRSYTLPIVPRRGDHYRIKLEGHGGCRVYSLAREYYDGSSLKSLPGRQ